MSAKRKLERSSTSNRLQLIYVVLQRSSAYGDHGDEHNVSCVSVHTNLAAANQAAKLFFDVDDDEIADKEDGWQSWEDLVGLRMQIDAEGKVRLIRMVDRREEDLVWVEEKFIEEDIEDDESGNDSDSEHERQGHDSKRLKASTFVGLLLL